MWKNIIEVYIQFLFCLIVSACITISVPLLQFKLVFEECVFQTATAKKSKCFCAFPEIFHVNIKTNKQSNKQTNKKTICVNLINCILILLCIFSFPKISCCIKVLFLTLLFSIMFLIHVLSFNTSSNVFWSENWKSCCLVNILL